MSPAARGPLPPAEYERIYARVPRLTVEVVVVAAAGGVLLARRREEPCAGLWHIPGGTVRFGEPLTEAVHRVVAEELDLEVTIGGLLGYIEYPSHLELGLDWPVGIAFQVALTPSSAARFRPVADVTSWFSEVPGEMHEEQKAFLRAHGLAS